jgi:hypothetical protein
VKNSLSLVLLCALTACELDLPIASKIEHMRVLTAVSEVEGDPTRSSPTPGETARVTWEMAYPQPLYDDSELASLFFVCTAPTRFSGTPLCEEFISGAFAGRQGTGSDAPPVDLSGGLSLTCDQPDLTFDVEGFRAVCVTGTPKLDIAVADDFKAEAKLMQGIICQNGSPRLQLGIQPKLECVAKPDLEPGAVREEISVYGTVPVQQDADTENRNPRSDAATFEFHDPPILWEPTDDELESELSDERCGDLAREGRVMSSEGDEESLTIRYDADAREDFEGKPEPLTLSAYTTFGELSARFTVFKSDAKAPLKREITWELSESEREKLKSDKHVRFYFTVQDGRGGYAVTHRDLCVVR